VTHCATLCTVMVKMCLSCHGIQTVVATVKQVIIIQSKSLVHLQHSNLLVTVTSESNISNISFLLYFMLSTYVYVHKSNFV